MNTNTNKMVKISLLSAIAVILMYFDFPILPAFPYLKIDLSDVPALLGGFGFGPLAGILIELVKNIVILLIKGTSTGFVGEFANFIIGVSLILPASFIYSRSKSKKNAIIGMVIGAISIEVVGILANVYILLPLYNMPLSGAELMKYVTTGLLPFNGIKAVMVSVLTYVLYKRVSVSVFNADPNFGSIERNTKAI
jgi:Predicted membrane protein